MKELFIVMMKNKPNEEWEIFRDFDSYEEASEFCEYHIESWKYFKVEKWFTKKKEN